MSEKCDVCGRPATCHVSDQIGLEPEQDDRGFVYPRWEQSAPHHFCDEHARPGRKKPWRPPAGWAATLNVKEARCQPLPKKPA